MKNTVNRMCQGTFVRGVTLSLPLDRPPEGPCSAGQLAFASAGEGLNRIAEQRICKTNMK